MSRRALFVLALLALFTSFAAVWSWTAAEQASEAFEGRGQPVFPVLVAQQEDPEELRVSTPDYALDLRRAAAGWVAPAHGDFPVSQSLTARLISEMASLRRWAPKTSRADLYDRIGVEDPEGDTATSSRVTLFGAGDRVLADAIIGRRSASIGARAAGGSFLRVPGEEQAWLVEGVVTLPESIGAWIGTLIQIPAPEVRRVSVLEGDRLVFDAEKAEGASVYTLAFADPRLTTQGAIADDEAVKSVTRGVVSVTALDVRARDSVAFDADGRSLVFETISGLRLTVQLGHADGEPWIAFDAEALPGSGAEAAAAALASRLADWAFLLEPGRAEPFYVPETELVGGAAAPAVVPPAPAAPPLPPGLLGPGVFPVVPGNF